MYKLRDYQQAAVDSVISHFKKSSDPALITLPTGAGKSLVIAELAKLAIGRVLVLTHVKELVEQNHEKFESYDLKAGIFSAGLQRKDTINKVIFAGVQSLVSEDQGFYRDFTIVIIDECHRVSIEGDTQYSNIIAKLKKDNPKICILGLTATPYRLGLGWIYEYHAKGELKTKEKRFFKKCIFELPLKYMVDHGYLTPPIQIDSPVACYDFSALMRKTQGRKITQTDLEATLKDQGRITPSIVKNIIDISEDRQGVMIFTSTVKHAIEILGLLPKHSSRLILGSTDMGERDEVIRDFKAKKVKYLVNVSVLTTGFDAPHVDVIALLRPTESIGLYQQIVGRGLRLSPEKENCLILDYTGLNYNIYQPEIGQDKPHTDSVPVEVACPLCGFNNHFWGLVDEEGILAEHFGRQCQGASEDESGLIIPCNYKFRFKVCDKCMHENDIAARTCQRCENTLVDTDKKLKEAMSLKDAHVMKPDSMLFLKSLDKKKNERLEIRYYDLDGEFLNEYFYLDSKEACSVFALTFARMHLRIPARDYEPTSLESILKRQDQFKMPLFVIARKVHNFWKIREKIFYKL